MRILDRNMQEFRMYQCVSCTSIWQQFKAHPNIDSYGTIYCKKCWENLHIKKKRTKEFDIWRIETRIKNIERKLNNQLELVKEIKKELKKEKDSLKRIVEK